jgi:hypothetical protein
MFPGWAMSLAVLAISCGDSPREITPPPTEPSHLERMITEQLSAKLGRSAKVTCTPTPTCVADLGDATLPIAIKKSADGTTWQVSGLLVRSAPIESYLRDALEDLGAKQSVRCGPALRSVEPGARIECALERGGTAFATIAENGTFSTEIVLDPASAAARSKDMPDGSLRDRGSASPGDVDDDDD